MRIGCYIVLTASGCDEQFLDQIAEATTVAQKSLYQDGFTAATYSWPYV